MLRCRSRLAGMALLLAAGCLDPSKPGNLVPRTVIENPALPSFQLRDGVKIHLQTLGDANDPVLIVLHGGPGADHRALLALSALSERYFMVYWDQRGAGLSQRLDARQVDGPTYLADLEELVDHFSPNRPVTLLGHSWGGPYAAYYIQNHPDRVAQVVMLESGPMREPDWNLIKFTIYPSDRFVSDTLWATNFLTPDDHARIDFLTSVAISEGGLGREQFRNPADPANIVGWRYGQVSQNAIVKWWLTDTKYDMTVGLKDRFKGDVLLVGGDFKGATGGSIGYDFQKTVNAKYWANPRVEEIADADHGLPYRNTADVLAVLKTFLTQYR